MSSNQDTTTQAQAPGHYFATTRWTQVGAAQDPQSPQAGAALEELCRAYWQPLYSWLRRQGRTKHDAQDLTQEFFARLLAKDWLSAADREKGRFRTFLLVSLKRFLADEWDRSRAQKRGGGQTVTGLGTELAEQQPGHSDAHETPDRAYERQWAMTLLERALRRLRSEFERDGRQTEFEAMKDFLTADRGEIPYAEVAARLQIQEGAARVAVHRLRKRFRELFRLEIAGTVARDEDIEDELRCLVAALSRSL